MVIFNFGTLTLNFQELFIKELALAGYADLKNSSSSKLNYNNLVNVVHKDSRYSFLEYMIPKKITVREYKEMMRKKEKGTSSESGSTDDSEEEGSSASNETGSDAGSEGKQPSQCLLS